jgi:hypothetical protein
VCVCVCVRLINPQCICIRDLFAKTASLAVRPSLTQSLSICDNTAVACSQCPHGEPVALAFTSILCGLGVVYTKADFFSLGA